MTLQIPLSLSGPPAAFAAAVAAHLAELVAHQMGPPGVPAPLHSSSLVNQIVVRAPGGGFEVVPHAIVDDRPTLEEHKTALVHRLQMAAAVARNDIISPARLELLNLDFGEALNTPEESRTPAQTKAIEAYVAIDSRRAEITRNAVLAAVEIEDLPSIEAAEAWKVPAL